MKKILLRLAAHEVLSKEEAEQVMLNMAAGQYSNEHIAAFLTVFNMRAITLDEFVGFRDALLTTAKKIDLSDFETVDVVGTGGDGKNTFNISTLSCFVLAGAGFKVAKHGNFGSSSVSGASNVLLHYGANFTNDEDIIKKSIDQSGFCFLHAPLFNPGMKYAAPVRKALAVPTFFNLMGPLINPARPNHQLWGVYNLEKTRLYNYVCQKTGIDYTLAHSTDGYDEISLTAPAKIITRNSETVVTPEQLGFERASQTSLSGGDSVESAAVIFMNVLDNKATAAQKNAVLANAAFAIQNVHKDKDIQDCIGMARESLESGKAKKAFEKFIEIYC